MTHEQRERVIDALIDMIVAVRMVDLCAPAPTSASTRERIAAEDAIHRWAQVAIGRRLSADEMAACWYWG